MSIYVFCYCDEKFGNRDIIYLFTKGIEDVMWSVQFNNISFNQIQIVYSGFRCVLTNCPFCLHVSITIFPITIRSISNYH